jgi:hypothetical protein
MFRTEILVFIVDSWYPPWILSNSLSIMFFQLAFIKKCLFPQFLVCICIWFQAPLFQPDEVQLFCLLSLEYEIKN